VDQNRHIDCTEEKKRFLIELALTIQNTVSTCGEITSVIFKDVQSEFRKHENHLNINSIIHHLCYFVATPKWKFSMILAYLRALRTAGWALSCIHRTSRTGQGNLQKKKRNRDKINYFALDFMKVAGSGSGSLILIYKENRAKS
jgi:hypothetical protein